MASRTVSKRLAGLLCLALSAWFTGCGCPKGTVKCKMGKIEAVLDFEGKTIEYTKTYYSTCVLPGQCPTPPPGVGIPEPGGPETPGLDPADPDSSGEIGDELLATLGVRLALGQLTVSPEDIQFHLRALRGGVGAVQEADVEVRAVRMDLSGAVEEELVHSAELEIHKGLGSEWILTPAAEQGGSDFVRDLVDLFLESENPGDTMVSYHLRVRLAKLPSTARAEDFHTELRVAGLTIDP